VCCGYNVTQVFYAIWRNATMPIPTARMFPVMLDLFMRLFVALDLEDEIRQRIGAFVNELRKVAADVRWAGAESLHVTLKFIGEQADERVGQFESALSTVSGPAFQISFRQCGFFPNAKSARVFWVGIEAGPQLAQLAADVETVLAPLGIEKEKRPFSPHLTLARSRGGSGAPGHSREDRPNRSFAAVQAHMSNSATPEFGTMTAREFFLYRSQLSSQGSKYTKIARFALDSQGEQK
jgi:2'-5' RNA ligase